MIWIILTILSMLEMRITMVMVETVDYQINRLYRETNNKTTMEKTISKTTKD